MIIRDHKIQGRFKYLLKAHTRVDIATAWATRGEHLRMLAEATKQEQRRVEVRAIVGTAGNATCPDALEELYESRMATSDSSWAGVPCSIPSCTCSAGLQTGA